MKRFKKPRHITALLAAALLAIPINPMTPVADASHFGFKGGFRGGFGHGGFHRGFGGFHRRGFSRGFGGFHRGFGGFHRSGFRGFSTFGRSRFNSLAFRGRGLRFGVGVGFGRGFNRGFAGVNRGFHPGFGGHGFGSRGVIGVPRVVGRPVLVGRVVTGDGWQLLRGGNAVLATQAFQQQIARDPSAGVPKVGFALAAASAGDLEKGVWAMRRAFQADPQRVGEMMLEDELRPLVARVTSEYENMANNKGIDADSAFMMAALYQLQGDPEMASMAMEYTVGEDKGAGQVVRHASTENLATLISNEMAAMPMARGKGWDLLAAGRPASARDAFVAAIGHDATAGEPKVGFALASAAVGDLDRGVWAMRRAFAMDPERTGGLMLSGKLRPLVKQVTKAYEAVEPNADAMFMLAALYQLQDDADQAMHAIEDSMKGDKQAPGGNSLFQLVSDEVELEKQMKAGADYQSKHIDAQGPEPAGSGTIALPPPPIDSPVGEAEPAIAPPVQTERGNVHDYALDRPRGIAPNPFVVRRPVSLRYISSCGY